MNDRPWWTDTAIYHIYPRSFQDSNGDGIGDLPGITRRIPYLSSLGVGAIWMGPVFRSPQVDNGYDISDYRDIDPIFGTLEDMDVLIETAHRNGIRVLLDLVFNHSSNRHRWFVESEHNPDGPYGDYYIWRDPAPDGGVPNNWTSFFSGPTWTWSPIRGQYYLHLFAPEQPDLNWENPQVRNEVADVARFWRARGVDGFRMDVINFISKVDGLPSIDADAGDPAGSMGRIIDSDRVLTYLQEFRSRIDPDGEVVLVGETPHIAPDDARRYTARESRALDMVLLFEHVMLDHGPGGRWDPVRWRPDALASVVAAHQRLLAGTSWPSLYMGNHDQPRIVSRYGDPVAYRVRSAAALATYFYLQRGTPIIYQGDEIGMANLEIDSPEQLVDVESSNAYRDLVDRQGVAPDEALRRVRDNARDNARTPMHWDGGPHGGFMPDASGDGDGDGDAHPWYPVHPDAARWNVAAQESAPADRSVLAFYRRLLRARRTSEPLRSGEFAPLAADGPVLGYLRGAHDSEALVIANLSGTGAPVPPDGRTQISRATDWQILLTTADLAANLEESPDGADESGVAANADEPGQRSPLADLAPWEARVLVRRLA